MSVCETRKVLRSELPLSLEEFKTSPNLMSVCEARKEVLSELPLLEAVETSLT
jgi:hypothetical protein